MTNSRRRTQQSRDDLRSDLLSGAYREAVEKAAAEPPRSVDDAVRAAAHRAVETRLQSIEAARLRLALRRWRTPLALAATLLLGVGIALRVYKPGQVELASPNVPTRSPIAEDEPSAKKEAGKTQSKIGQERGQNKSGGTASPRDAARPSEKRPPLQLEVAEKAGATRKNALSSSGLAADKVERDRGSESGAPQAGMQPERGEPQPAAKPFPGTPTTGSAPPPPREPAAVSPTPMPAQTSDAPGLTLSRSPAQGRAERKEEGKTSAGSLTSVQLLARRLDGKPPEMWIEEIRSLKRARRGAEAEELLAMWRKKFPNFAVPDDLK